MGTRILAIDDDAALLELIRDNFSGQEWELRTAGTAREGLLSAAAGRPDVILLDVSLPDAEGWDVCRRLRETAGLAEVPILLISGKRKESDDIVSGLKAGADDYIPKPIKFALLREKIKTILRKG